jgi:hypothetical protein
MGGIGVFWACAKAQPKINNETKKRETEKEMK